MIYFFSRPLYAGADDDHDGSCPVEMSRCGTKAVSCPFLKTHYPAQFLETERSTDLFWQPIEHLCNLTLSLQPFFPFFDPNKHILDASLVQNGFYTPSHPTNFPHPPKFLLSPCS
jgi:hypothetical protein